MDEYKALVHVGEGNFSKVYLVERKKDEKLFAMKVSKKVQEREEDESDDESEEESVDNRDLLLKERQVSNGISLNIIWSSRLAYQLSIIKQNCTVKAQNRSKI